MIRELYSNLRNLTFINKFQFRKFYDLLPLKYQKINNRSSDIFELSQE